MSEFALQESIPLGLADLGLLATVGLRTIHVYDKLCVVVLSTDSGKIRDSNKIMIIPISRIYSNETSVIQTLQSSHPIIHFNKLINYLDPRPEYIRAIIIEWPTKFSIPIAHTVSPDNQ
ncbi:unnamed protein product [Rotaria magnacalcarata]|uniref:Uncharacterized protein n=1 Tax=Rotaria magnacalcarata TaxID=392030 RepID=A0A815H1R6_9BILA|nr:unnamed protein product [Rotaria magnacalcarata]CAF4233727.1 unnamed protein product [Rotaria magnacalcarata]